MITCPRCGQTVRIDPADATVCPRCGAPLGPGAPSVGASVGVTESGIPVWLKQLQAQQQVGPARHAGPQAGPPLPQARPGAPGGVAPSSLISEDALPAWLRTDATTAAGNGAVPAGPGASANFVPGRGFGVPAPVPAGQFTAGAAGGEGSLIDESALPVWLRQGGNGMHAGGLGMVGQGAGAGIGQPPYPPAYQPGYPGAAPVPGAPAAPGYGAGGMAVGSLIDERSLPAWMQQPNAARQPVPSQSANARREGMDARSLVDDTSLPQWLRGAQAAGQPEAMEQASQWNPGLSPQQPMPAWMMPGQGAGAPVPPPIPTDDSALPPWLRAQSAAAPQVQPAPLDPAAIPPWARSGVSAAADGWSASSAGQPAARQAPNSAWLTDAHVPAASNGTNSSSGANYGGVPESQLPPWLRQGAPRQPASGSSGRMRLDQLGATAADPGGYSSSRMRGADPRQASNHRGYGGQGYGDNGWDEDEAYPAEEDEQDGRLSRERRKGLFGFLRRRP